MKKILNPVWAILVTVALGLAGCGPTAYIEKDPGLNLGDYKSYGWSEKKDQKVSIAEQQIREAAELQLASITGWSNKSNQPDVLLSYDVLTERTNHEQSNPVYSNPMVRTFYNPYAGRFYRVYYPSQFMGYDSYSVPGNEGTITITLTDAKTGKTIMQGWATDEIRSRKLSSSEADKIVSAIFKKFNNQLAKR